MLRYLTSGESHGEALIGLVEGMPAGVPVTAEAIDEHLARRWLGYGRGGRAKFERDKVHVYAGLRFGQTMGHPIALKLGNEAYHRDKSGWPDIMATGGSGEGVEAVTLPRPGHADLVGVQKYAHRAGQTAGGDIRPVIERSSARETAMRVACCSVARCLLEAFGIHVGSHVVALGEVAADASTLRARRDALLAEGGARALYQAADTSELRMLDPELTARGIEHIKAAKKSGDSLGGVYEVVATGVPPGLGSYAQWDRKLDGLLAQAILSIQAQKAVEIGDGVEAARAPGSQVHDAVTRDAGVLGGYGRATNRAGGIEGGMTNGQPVVVRGYMKPIPTLISPLGTVDLATGDAQPTRYERSDVTSVPAASTVAEAVVAWTLASALVERLGGDSLDAMQAAWERAWGRRLG
jgi:chorismate synthase